MIYRKFFLTMTAALTWIFLGCVPKPSSNSKKFSEKKKQTLPLSELEEKDIAILFALPRQLRNVDRLLPIPLSVDDLHTFLNHAHETFERYSGSFENSAGDKIFLGTGGRISRTRELIGKVERWRVVAVVLTCFQARPSKNAPCNPRLRVTAQPLFRVSETLAPDLPNLFHGTTCTPLKTTLHQESYFQEFPFALRTPVKNLSLSGSHIIAEDQAIQLNFDLTEEELRQVIGLLLKLRGQSPPTNRLWVHPEFANMDDELPENARAFLDDLQGFLREKLPSSAMVQFTAVFTKASGWVFQRFQRQGDGWTPALVNPGKEESNGNSVFVYNEHSSYSWLPFQQKLSAERSKTKVFKDSIVADTNRMFWAIAQADSQQAADLKARVEGIEDKLIRVMDRELHSDLSVDCFTCHGMTSQLASSPQFDKSFSGARVGEESPDVEILNWDFASSRLSSYLSRLGVRDRERQTEGKQPKFQLLLNSDLMKGWYPLHGGFVLRNFGYFLSYPAIGLPTYTSVTHDLKWVRSLRE